MRPVNKAFNDEVKTDFLTVRYRDGNYEILNIVDTSTGYGERSIVESGNEHTTGSKFEECSMCGHGSPGHFNADPEFCQPVFAKYVERNEINVNRRAEQSSNTNGLVERSSGTFKSIFDKPWKEKTKASTPMLVLRASFMTNIIFGQPNGTHSSWREVICPPLPDCKA